jgi:glutamine amidotransferase/cyclase
MPNNEQRIYLLDYGAGNVRSLVNAVESLGYSLQIVKTNEDFEKADVKPSYRYVFKDVS